MRRYGWQKRVTYDDDQKNCPGRARAANKELSKEEAKQMELSKSQILEIVGRVRKELAELEADLLQEPDDLDLWLYQEELNTIGGNLARETEDEDGED